MNTNEIWFQKYRPSTLDDMILSDENRKIIESYGKNVPNLLFCGRPGTGKCLDGDEELEVYVESKYEYDKIMDFLECVNRTDQDKYINDYNKKNQS